MEAGIFKMCENCANLSSTRFVSLNVSCPGSHTSCPTAPTPSSPSTETGTTGDYIRLGVPLSAICASRRLSPIKLYYYL